MRHLAANGYNAAYGALVDRVSPSGHFVGVTPPPADAAADAAVVAPLDPNQCEASDISPPVDIQGTGGRSLSAQFPLACDITGAVQGTGCLVRRAAPTNPYVPVLLWTLTLSVSFLV